MNKMTDTEMKQVRESLISHLDNLQKFAEFSEEDRFDIIKTVFEQIGDRYQFDPVNFTMSLEFAVRLHAIDKTPILTAEDVRRMHPSGERDDPKKFIEEFIKSRRLINGSFLEDGIPYSSAESALWITFGLTGKLNNRSLLIVVDSDGNKNAIEFPFAIAEEIAFRGGEAFARGNARTSEDYGRFKQIIDEYLRLNYPEEFSGFYEHNEFCFYAFSSLREISDLLDEITFSDGIIETPEDKS